MHIVYITCSNQEEAKEIASALLKRRLAACANILPSMHSMYWWKEEIKESHEALLIVKTEEYQLPDLEECIREHHSYDVPCIVAWPMDYVSEPFETWLQAQLKTET